VRSPVGQVVRTMAISQDQNGQRSATRRADGRSRDVGGMALMLLGVALMGYGAHYLAKTGTCSGTGYVSYGPVPKCGGSEALYIMSAFFIGPLIAVVGWVLVRASGLLWPTFCVGVGIGLITLRNDATAAAGAKAFGLVSGIGLFAFAVVSVIVSLRKRSERRKAKTAPAGMTSLGVGSTLPSTATPADTPLPARLAPAGARAANGDGADPFDKIAKLSQLRDFGALTESEFEQQKARLLAQM
jgi:hypothetical protein